MRKSFVIALTALFVSACGGGDGGRSAGPGASSADNPACLLISDAAAIFGAEADVAGYGASAPVAASCQFTSADGTRSGDVLLFTSDSMGAVTAAEQAASLAEAWDNASEAELQPVPGFDPSARMASGFPGFQTQIVFAKGEQVIAVMGSSGDASMSGEQIALALANAANTSAP